MVLQVDFLGESTEGNLHLVSRASSKSYTELLGLSSPRDILEVPMDDLKDAQQVIPTAHTAQYCLPEYLKDFIFNL